jgi:hypothetical protein|tara:strand:- start:485 stop:751 length:267 start_codon:yes stop_codon:yes gene_type:complete
MTFTQAREDYFSSNQVDYSVEIQRDIYEELSTHFEELDLDFLQEIVEIQRDILDEAGKYKGTYLEDFDFDYPEIEYSVFGSDICGGRN